MLSRHSPTRDVLACIYAPSGYNKQNERLIVFKDINKKLKTYTKNNENIILLGHFNMILSPKDGQTQINTNCTSTTELQQLITDLVIEHRWRIEHPDQNLYTHYHTG